MSWLSRIIDGPPDTPPPLSKRELKDIVDANRGTTSFKGMSNKEIKEWARSKHKDFQGIEYGNQFGGIDIVVKAKSINTMRHIQYDGNGKYANTYEIGITGH